MKEYQFYALKDSNLTQNVSSLEIWFEKSGWRNLVQEIQFEKSGSRIRKKIQFLEPLFFPSQELEKFQLFPSKSESRLQTKSPRGSSQKQCLIVDCIRYKKVLLLF